jgi:hypothetical protein
MAGSRFRRFRRSDETTKRVSVTPVCPCSTMYFNICERASVWCLKAELDASRSSTVGTPAGIIFSGFLGMTGKDPGRRRHRSGRFALPGGTNTDLLLFAIFLERELFGSKACPPAGPSLSVTTTSTITSRVLCGWRWSEHPRPACRALSGQVYHLALKRNFLLSSQLRG